MRRTVNSPPNPLDKIPDFQNLTPADKKTLTLKAIFLRNLYRNIYVKQLLHKRSLKAIFVIGMVSYLRNLALKTVSLELAAVAFAEMYWEVRQPASLQFLGAPSFLTWE